MPREIFGEVTNPAPGLGSQSRYTLPVSVAVHVVIAAGVVIVPLMAADVLPAPRTVIGAFTASPAPPVPPPPAASRSATPSEKTPAVASTAAPREAPSSIEPEQVTTTTAIDDLLLVPLGPGGGAIGGVGVVPDIPLPPAPPPPTQPVPIGGRIKEPAKIRHVPPVYPVIAQQARVDGIVIIEAIIGIDGRVTQARVLRSKPLLEEAALEAVRQWVFTPTTLNGVPVPVIMTVTVNFRLH